MADITGAAATSYDLPNYVGELFFQKSERPNAFLRLIGGLSAGIRQVGASVFPMGVNYVLAAPAQPNILEGADPVLTEEDTTQASNVLQIFQEGVGLTYTRESSKDAIGGVAIIPGSGNGDMIRPGTFEWQVARAVERIQGQMNFSFLRGAFVSPANNSTARRTRGVRTGVTTNATNLAAAALSKANLELALKTYMGNGMFNLGDDLVCLGDATALEKVIALYATQTVLPESRTIVGVSVRRIVTTWCNLDLVYEPDMAALELFITKPARIQPVAMPIIARGVAKGLLFREELAHTGSKSNEQVYGEWGVDYGDEIFHGVVSNFT